jgi:RNA polymerase sigma-70 factor (ECF subfamily)
MCRNTQDAEDILQDTLLQMARGVRDFRGDSSIATWLYTIARSYCIKKRRKSKFAPTHEHSLEAEAAGEARQLADPAAAPDEKAASKQLEVALEQAIASLEPGYREVLVLRDVEGLTAPEVAKVVGISNEAVKSRLHRARKALRDQVAPLLGVPPAAAPGSNCPDVLTLFSQHLEDEISADTCAAMERHLAGCERCRSQCDSLRETLALCSATPRKAVPPKVERAVRDSLRAFLAEQDQG